MNACIIPEAVAAFIIRYRYKEHKQFAQYCYTIMHSTGKEGVCKTKLCKCYINPVLTRCNRFGKSVLCNHSCKTRRAPRPIKFYFTPLTIAEYNSRIFMCIIHMCVCLRFQISQNEFMI